MRVSADGKPLIYRRGDGDPALGTVAEKFLAGEAVWLVGQEGNPWEAAPGPAGELAAGAARVARTLQAKGYLVIVTPVAELYAANGWGGEPAIELVMINPADGARMPVLLLAGTLAQMEQAAKRHPPAGLRLATPGGIAH